MYYKLRNFCLSIEIFILIFSKKLENRLKKRSLQLKGLLVRRAMPLTNRKKL